jgi:hypothetical protein
MSRRTKIVTFAALTALAVACGSNGGEDAPGPFGVGELAPTDDPLYTGSTGGRGGGSGGGSATSCQPTADDSGCVGEVYAGETIPLDIYIMFDVSCSMSCPVSTTGQPGQCCPGEPDPRIDPTRQAIDEFLNDQASAGISVGIGYFGFMQSGSTSCDPNDYSTPSVPIAPLPGNAADVMTSLNGEDPTGETPTGTAIRGACSYANEWHAAHAGHAMAILLVTDGVPEVPSSQGCTASVADAAAAAEECLQGASPIPTYVLGIGLALDNLNQIAVGGGTEQAYLVDGGRDSVLQALNAIRAAAMIPCELTIPPAPPGETLSYDQVNIGVCDASGTVVTTYYVETPEGCDPTQGGWYYDDPATPERVMLCGATCDTVSVAGARLFYSIGCQTQTVIE